MLDKKEKSKIAEKLSDWYCRQNLEKPWLEVEEKSYVPMVENFGENSLDLSKERDVFKLFALAIIWTSRKHGRFEAGLRKFEELNKQGMLDNIFNREIPRDKKQNSITQSISFLRKNWEEIYPSLMELDTDSDVEIYIHQIHNIFVNGFRRNETNISLKVKNFLILREINSQNILDINDDYCCVPDNNVRNLLYFSGLWNRKSKRNPSVDFMIDVSKVVSKFFNGGDYRLFDMPLFWFYRKVCKKEDCKDCLVSTHCLRRK